MASFKALKFQSATTDEESPLTSAIAQNSKETVGVNAAFGAFMSVLYIAVSASMIMHVKFLMHAQRFPFAPFLTAAHMLNAFCFGLVLRRISPGLFPSAPIVFADCDSVLDLVRVLRPFAIIACFGMMAIVVGNAAYLYADVSFLQMVKEGHVVIVYSLMVAFGLEVLRFRYVLVLAFVGISAMLCVHGASRASFTEIGLIMQIGAGFCGSLQQVMQNKLMSQSKGPRIDPLTMVLCTAPLMFAAVLPMNFLAWDPQILVRLQEWLPHILANMLLAFCLQVISAMTIKAVSATGLALASVLKDIAIVIAASSLMGDVLTGVQVCGFVGSVTGIGLYSVMKIYPELFDYKGFWREDPL